MVAVCASVKETTNDVFTSGGSSKDKPQEQEDKHPPWRWGCRRQLIRSVISNRCQVWKNIYLTGFRLQRCRQGDVWLHLPWAVRAGSMLILLSPAHLSSAECAAQAGVTEQQCGSQQQQQQQKNKNMDWGKSATGTIKVEKHLALSTFSIWSSPSRSRSVRCDQEREWKSLGGDHLLLTNWSDSGTEHRITAAFAISLVHRLFLNSLTWV